jgi:hypothetical protein
LTARQAGSLRYFRKPPESPLIERYVSCGLTPHFPLVRSAPHDDNLRGHHEPSRRPPMA